ncbi:MAG: hypothetical protein ACYSUF_07795 [Planctomycetota bacterium]|jgi:hypothetical protein
MTESVPNPYQPTREEVDDLIRRAEEHQLGTEYLVEGALDSVAATFQVHAFVIEAARAALAGETDKPPV